MDTENTTELAGSVGGQPEDFRRPTRAVGASADAARSSWDASQERLAAPHAARDARLAALAVAVDRAELDAEDEFVDASFGWGNVSCPGCGRPVLVGDAIVCHSGPEYLYRSDAVRPLRDHLGTWHRSCAAVGPPCLPNQRV